MHIKACEIEKKSQIGTLKGRPVFEIATRGGFHLICSPQKDGIEYMSSGSHRALSRHLAKKKYADFKMTVMEKSVDIPIEFFARQIPYYEAITKQLNDASKK